MEALGVLCIVNGVWIIIWAFLGKYDLLPVYEPVGRCTR